ETRMTREPAGAGQNAEHAARSRAVHATSYAVLSVQPLTRDRASTRCRWRGVPDAQWGISSIRGVGVQTRAMGLHLVLSLLGGSNARAIPSAGNGPPLPGACR